MLKPTYRKKFGNIFQNLRSNEKAKNKKNPKNLSWSYTSKNWEKFTDYDDTIRFLIRRKPNEKVLPI